MMHVQTRPEDTKQLRVEPPAEGVVAGIGGGKYLRVTSFRRGGAAVATPVWFVTEGGRFLVMTDKHSGKVSCERAHTDR